MKTTQTTQDEQVKLKKYISQGNMLERVEKDQSFMGFVPWWKRAQQQSEELGEDEEEAKQRHILAIPEGFGNRSTIKGFSKGSCKRLATELSTCDFTKALFITLTQSSNENLTPQLAKVYLNQMGKSWTKRGISAIWRLEKQQSGNPHFHLIVFNFSYTNQTLLEKELGISLKRKKIRWDTEKRIIERQWHKYAFLKEKCRCDVSDIWSSTGAYLYLVGHSSKRNQTWENQEVGRYWGYINRDQIPRAEKVEIEVTENAEYVLNAIWDKKEARRLRWLKSRKGVDAEAREWMHGSVKLFTRNPITLFLRFQRCNGKVLLSGNGK